MTAIDRRTAIAGTAAVHCLPASRRRRRNRKAPRVEMQPDLGDAFTEADTAGTFAVLDPSAGNRLVVTDRERAETGFLPASTFKIPNSLIALETGVVADADSTMFPWDKVVRDFDAWNQDHTLRSAFKASAVPVFQDIARKIGPERMQQYVDKFDYGNRDIGGGDRHVLARREACASRRCSRSSSCSSFYRGELPVSKQNQEIVRDIMYLELSEFGTLRGKTGAVGIAVAPGSKATLGWLVGWLEHGRQAALHLRDEHRRARAEAARAAAADHQGFAEAFALIGGLAADLARRPAVRSRNAPGAGDTIAGGVADNAADDGADRTEHQKAGADAKPGVDGAVRMRSRRRKGEARGDGRGCNRQSHDTPYKRVPPDNAEHENLFL